MQENPCVFSGGNLEKKTRKQELDQECDQENKNSTKKATKEKGKDFLFFLITLLVEFLFSCFLIFLLTTFLFFFYKFPPQKTQKRLEIRDLVVVEARALLSQQHVYYESTSCAYRFLRCEETQIYVEIDAIERYTGIEEEI